MRAAVAELLQRQVERCYVAPAGATARVVLPVLEIRLMRSGGLEAPPRIVRAGANAVDRALSQAALDAVRRCAPYRLPDRFVPFYEDWRMIHAEFEFPEG